MNFKRLLHTELGILVISVLMGLGLATLFRKACNDKNCIIFNGPVIDTVTGKTYQYGEYCYKYSIHPVLCNKNKKIVDIKNANELE